MYFTGDGGTAQSDLFSLVVITYQMLTGSLPYGLQVPQLRGPTDLHTLHYTSLRHLRHLRRELPPWIDAVLRQALHPQTAKRQEKNGQKRPARPHQTQ